MAQLTVTLIRADTNQEFEVELPDDVRLESLLPQLVEQLGLPLVGPTGDRILYELSNKRTGAAYQESDTLSSQNTKNGDLILLTSTFVAGRNRQNNRAAPKDQQHSEALVGGPRSSRDRSNALARQDHKSWNVPFFVLTVPLALSILP